MVRDASSRTGGSGCGCSKGPGWMTSLFPKPFGDQFRDRGDQIRAGDQPSDLARTRRSMTMRGAMPRASIKSR